MDTPKRFVNSRRFKLLLPLISALVLLVGVGAVLGTYFSNTAKVEPSNPTGSPIQVVNPPKNIPFPEAAWSVARQFASTAVARRNLAESYAISHSTLRAGFTLKQWETGTLPSIPFFPVAAIEKTNWKNTNYAHPRDAQINAILYAPRSSKQRPLHVQIGLRKVGNGSDAHWLVDYFAPLGGPPVPAP